MANEWAGVVNTTAIRYMKGATDATIRKRLVLAMMKKRGRIIIDKDGGYDLRHQIRSTQHGVTTRGDMAPVTYSRVNQYQQLSLDVRGYVSTDVMGSKEKVMNRGSVALIDRYARIIPTLRQDLTDKFGTEVYTDGYATGNQDSLVGFNSFTGTSTTVAADIIAKPSDNYGGKNTDLGDLGGSWSSALSTFPNASVANDWPDGAPSGTSGSEYDYMTPKLANWSSLNWGTGSTAWEDNCERVFRRLTGWCEITGGAEGLPDIYMCASNLFDGYANHFSSKQRLQVPFKEAEELGFPGSYQQEGVGIMREFGIPTNEFYGWNFDQCELGSMGSELFDVVGPTYDPTKDSWLFLIGFWGNMKFFPKAFSKGKNYA